MSLIFKQLGIGLLIHFILCSGCLAPGFAGDAPQLIPLPAVEHQGTQSLEELLWKRASTRSFSTQVPTWNQIGQLLWAAQGINRPDNQHRTTPSAGATYPLEIYVVLPDGVYHYLPKEHAVMPIRTGNVWEDLSKAGLKNSTVYQSPCVFLFFAVFERTASRFADQAPRYIYLEGGHAAQNLILQAVSLGMGTVPIGADLGSPVNDTLGIPGDQKSIYVLATGFPKENESNTQTNQ